MVDVTTWRELVVVLTLISLGLNLMVLVSGARLRSKMQIPLGLLCYVGVAIVINVTTITLRIVYSIDQTPYTIGDFVSLLPSLGFIVAAMVSLRRLGGLSITAD